MSGEGKRRCRCRCGHWAVVHGNRRGRWFGCIVPRCDCFKFRPAPSSDPEGER